MSVEEFNTPRVDMEKWIIKGEKKGNERNELSRVGKRNNQEKTGDSRESEK